MHLHKAIKSALYILSFLGLISSCKIADPPQMPNTSQLPSTFIGSNDTISMGDLIWEDFFNDPYLVQLIDVALSNNLDMLTALQRIEVARANFQIRKGDMRPTLDVMFRARTGNVKENLLDNTINGDNVANQTQNYFLGLQSSWEIDVWGKLKSRKEAAYIRYLATEKGKHLVTTSLVSEVARMYYELLGLDNEMQTLQKNIQFQETALEMIQIQKVGGRATELAVQQFQAQLLRTQSLKFEKQQRIIEVENELNLLLGRYPQTIERGESILDQHLPEIVRAGVPSDMLLRRPDIQQAELELAAAELDVKAARAEFLPSFEITPYTGFNTGNLTSLMHVPEALTLGLIGGITAPLLYQNRIQADYDKSIARNLAEYYTYRQRVLTGYQEVVSCLNRVENYTQVYELREQEAEVLSNSVGTSNDLFAAGYATYLEVITAQGRALEAELSMTNTRKEIFVSLIDLYRALGGGWK